jgi:hypothetical protein
MTPEDNELDALKARVAELEAKANPKPFTPEPYQRFDPTANISMPRSTMLEMGNAVPDHVMRGIVRDNRAPVGYAGVIPDRRAEVHPGRRSLGTGWRDATPLSNPPGVARADKLMDEADKRDRHELIQREEARRRAELARKR